MMKKMKIFLSTLCIAAALTLAIPQAVYAGDGSQGGTDKTPSKPQPPVSPSDLFWAIIHALAP
jgi:hypothetical protein